MFEGVEMCFGHEQILEGLASHTENGDVHLTIRYQVTLEIENGVVVYLLFVPLFKLLFFFDGECVG